LNTGNIKQVQDIYESTPDFHALIDSVTYNDNWDTIVDGKTMYFWFENEKQIRTKYGVLSDVAEKQLAEKIQMPFRYFQKMKTENPSLFLQSLNSWAKNFPMGLGNKQYLVRSVITRYPNSIYTGNKVRAILSNRYRRIDNREVIYYMLPILIANGYEIKSAKMTNDELYIKAVDPKAEIDISKYKQDDLIQAGISISNNELGLGGLTITPFVYRLVCTNGMMLPEMLASFNQVHLGKPMGTTDTDRTLESFYDNNELFLKVDLFVKEEQIKSKAKLTKIKEVFADAKEKYITGSTYNQSLQDVLNKLNTLESSVSLTDDERISIEQHIQEENIRMEGHDTGYYNMFELVNGITSYAGSISDYSRSTELEKYAGKVLHLPTSAIEHKVLYNS
tara:strand:+ start:5603 stop:6778 length:1176 start_codon:yes stop_codon:yes gene_type:complete